MILTSGTVYLPWGYKPVTKPAIKWIQKADGNWSGVDRTASADIFDADIIFKGPKTELKDLEDDLNSNRASNLAVTFSTGEEVFGADIDHTEIKVDSSSVRILDYGEPKRVSFAQYVMSLRLRLKTPVYTGSASLSALRLTSYAHQAGSEFDVWSLFSLDGNPVADFDHGTDPGIFIGNFTQTHTEMKNIRRYLLTTARANTLSSFDFSAFGVDEPFGQRYSGEGSSFNVKIIDWKDLGRKNFIDWGLQITFARVI